MANPWLRPAFGFDRGFEQYVLLEPRPEETHPRGVRVNEEAMRQLSRLRDSGQRFFLYLHYMDVHGPYRPAPDPRAALTAGLEGQDVYRIGPLPDADARDVEYTKALYDACIRELDERVHELLEGLRTLGLDENTLVVFTSDHGEEFFEHGGMGHGRTLHEEVIRTPLLFHGPGIPARRISLPVSSLDLLPTLLELLATPWETRFDGLSLASWILTGEQPPDTGLRALPSELGEVKAVRIGSRKLIRSHRSEPPQDQLFDLSGDPYRAAAARVARAGRPRGRPSRAGRAGRRPRGPASRRRARTPARSPGLSRTGLKERPHRVRGSTPKGVGIYRRDRGS